MASPIEEIGGQIALRRKDLNLGQQDLADLAGVSTRSIYALEHGKATMRLDTVIAIASTLGLDLVLRPRR